MDLGQLVTTVEESEDDPLGRVSAAATIKDQIEHLGDELLDRFVKEARTAECSWTQIGEALGVTRQAAQQRHGGLLDRLLPKLPKGKFQRFTKRSRAAVAAAQTAARDRQHCPIGTEHVLLGLFEAGDDGIAVVALTRLGLDRSTVERVVDERAGTSPVRGHIPFSPLAKKTLELALREALRHGHNYIGTEHIVLALCRVEDGIAGQILNDQGITYDELRTTILDILGTPTS